MAKISIGHRPDLTREDLFSIFHRQFEGKYEVIPTANISTAAFSFNGDLLIKESGWRGIRVRLDQEPNDTKIVFAGAAPSRLATAAISILMGFPALLLYNSMMNEVRAFIETAEEFSPPGDE